MTARERLAKRERNKRRIAEALQKTPRAPPQVGVLGKLYNTIREQPAPFLDAAGISFQNELLLRLAAGEELRSSNLSRTELMRLVETASDEELLDDKLVTDLVREIESRASGLDRIRRSGQFDLQNLLPRNQEITRKTRKTRKRTKTDKNMSKALRLANEKFRKKNGQLRKGATQAQIMRYAHKLLRKM
jgi:hypothetical protein